MRCSVALVLVSVVVVALLVSSARSAPQRGIDFLLGDEELQAVVKPIAGDAALVAEQQVLNQDGGEDGDEQQRVQPELPATVDPVENEQQTEDPAAGLTEAPEDEQDGDEQDEEQFTEEPQDGPVEPEAVTDQPTKDTVQTTAKANNDASPATTRGDATTPSPQESVTPSKEPSTTPDSAEEDNSSEEQLTANPIVVVDSKETSTTESNEDSNQLAEDVNSLVDDASNRVRFGADDNQDQGNPKPAAQPRPQPQPQPQPKAQLPEYSTALPPAPPVVPTSGGYDSKSLESHEDDDHVQVQLKVDPNDVQRTNGPALTEDQFRSLLPWFNRPRLTGYDQWQGPPQRSSWQPRDERPRQYQPADTDAFHGHGFHRGSSWH